ncbi:MAG: hypothetical protein AB1941_10495 [Gemmatimonadota bacterium]
MPLMIPVREELPADLLPTPLPYVRVLYEAEFPIVYVSKTSHGQPLLAYVSDATTEGLFTLLAPVSEATIAELERGSLAVRDALVSSWLWLHVFDGENGRLWVTESGEIPDGFLPLPGTPLFAEHEAVLKTRALGESLVLGRMPASVVAFVADATRKAMKTLLDFTFSARAEGRPTEEHRALYDLPIKQFAFASFELSFGFPDEGLFPREEVRRAAEKLEAGLVWAGDPSNENPLYASTDEERAAILRAALLLTPPVTGPIVEVQVSGSWLRKGAVRLTRESRRKVRQELRQVEQERVVTYHGRIGEMDVDNSTFILRDTPEGVDRKGMFSEEERDDMMEYFAEGARVTVAGVERQGRLFVAAVGRTAVRVSPPEIQVSTAISDSVAG